MLKRIGIQLAIGSRFRTTKGTFYVTGVVSDYTGRLGVDYVPDTFKTQWRESDNNFLSDEDFENNLDKIEML